MTGSSTITVPALQSGPSSGPSLNVQVLGLGVNATSVANSTMAILNPVLNVLGASLFAVLRRALGNLGIVLGGADGNLDTQCGARRLIG